MDESRLREIEERLEGRTRGEWKIPADIRSRVQGNISIMADGHIFLKGVRKMEDANFIAHAPRDIADLLAEVRRLRQMVGE